MSKIDLKIVNLYYGFDCNLTCRECFSGSDIIRNKQYDPSLESLLKSIEDMSQHISNITEMFTLIGGEPLLYWDRIVALVHHFRKFYPTTVINITTNGVLLHKHRKEVLDLLLSTDNIRISLTNHFSEFMEDPTGVKYKQNLEYFFSDPRINRIHALHYDIPNRNINFHLHEYAEGFKSQWQHIDGKLKPWATNDPQGSMNYGCTGNICSAIIDSKLFKCPRFVVLPAILDKVNQTDDSDWKKYLAYTPIDLSQEGIQYKLQEFEANQGHPISECDMCPNKHIINITQIPHTKENIFTKPYV